MYAEEDFNSLSTLYDNFTFNEAREFYERISEDYVHIDYDNKQISVAGYDVYDKKIIENCVTFDFINRTIIGIDEDGNYITLDGTESGE